VDAESASSAAWVDAVHVVVLARRPGTPEQPWVVEIGGEAASTLPIQGTWVSAGNSDSEIYVQTSSGLVRFRSGSTWSDVPGVHWPALPG